MIPLWLDHLRVRLLRAVERWTAWLARRNKAVATAWEVSRNIRLVKPGDGLRPGESWGYHQGKQERARRLRHSYRRALNLRDPASRNAMERLKRWASDEEDPYPVIWHVCHSAWGGVETTGKTWAEVVNFMIDRHEAEAREREA